jgi:hypothetical protein
MKNVTASMLLAILVAGCASSPRSAGVSYRQAQGRRLAAAVALLEKGEPGEAGNLLASVCAEPGVPGVTDEALFRLALLRLKTETEDEAARQTVERLQKEYPTSPWSRQAAPLLELLASQRELLRANSNLKSQNLSLSQEKAELTRERDELRARLEKLKNLDLELEKKSR